MYFLKSMSPLSAPLHLLSVLSVVDTHRRDPVDSTARTHRARGMLRPSLPLKPQTSTCLMIAWSFFLMLNFVDMPGDGSTALT